MNKFLGIAIIAVSLASCTGGQSIPSTTYTSSGATTSTMQTSSGSTTAEIKKSYTMTDVAKMKDVSGCYTIVSGKVYDLTPWVSKHPGGDKAILGICEQDGSEAFLGKHGEDPKKLKLIENFYIGDLQ